MIDGVVYTEDAAARINNAVIRTEHQPLGNPLDDGHDRPPVPPPAICEVLVTDSSITSCRPVYTATTQVWDTSCGFTTGDTVWVYEINDASVTINKKYIGKVMMSNFQQDGADSTTIRPLVQIYTGGV